ncbi:MAG: twin-arginine translocase TatA/TatE family subunit [Candidatus Acidiferrales bacterium]
MGPLGFTEILIILVLALLLFGPRRLPELGRAIGKGLAEFRRASNDLRATIEGEVRTLEREAGVTDTPPATPKVAPPAAGQAPAKPDAS